MADALGLKDAASLAETNANNLKKVILLARMIFQKLWLTLKMQTK